MGRDARAIGESVKSILVYLAASITLAYTLDYTIILDVIEDNRLLALPLLLARMATPTIGALLALYTIEDVKLGIRQLRQAASTELLIKPPRHGEWDKALFTPILLVLAGYAIPSLVLVYALGYQTCNILPLNGARGLLLILLLLVAAVVAALTVNLLAALLEEAGWRGFLYRRLRLLGLGPYTTGMLIGVVWGIWHAPLVYNGYNYAPLPVEGCTGPGAEGMVAVAAFTLYTIGLSILLTLTVERYGTVLSAAAGHGMVNAIGGLFALAVAGPRLIAPPAGVSVAVGMAIVGIAWHALAPRGARRVE